MNIESFDEFEEALEELDEKYEEIQSHREDIKSLREEGREIFESLLEFEQWHEVDIPSNFYMEFQK
jgi:chromosome segregation ATPase